MPSLPAELERIAALLERGLLTREEFEEQKRILLSESTVRASQTPRNPTELQEVGAYRLLGLIGEGGMGAVYRGRHRSETIAERQGGDVAVKVMHPQYTRNPDYRDRFEREATLGLKLDHSGIVTVHDLVVDGGNLALVMDYVDGQPLSASIGEAVGPIPWDEVWRLFEKLLEAIEYAHQQGVVHRDLKPENILVTADGEPKVIDFGIAKDLDSSGTRTGTGMGTVEYMAPEQYTDAKTVDHRADIYSLGMILYEMLAGRLPWDEDAPQFAILEQKARKQLMSPVAFCPDIPPEIVAALSPALSADPSGRPRSTGAFRISLKRPAPRTAAPIEPERQAQDRPEPRVPEEEKRKPKAEATGSGQSAGSTAGAVTATPPAIARRPARDNGAQRESRTPIRLFLGLVGTLVLLVVICGGGYLLRPVLFGGGRVDEVPPPTQVEMENGEAEETGGSGEQKSSGHEEEPKDARPGTSSTADRRETTPPTRSPPKTSSEETATTAAVQPADTEHPTPAASATSMTDLRGAWSGEWDGQRMKVKVTSQDGSIFRGTVQTDLISSDLSGRLDGSFVSLDIGGQILSGSVVDGSTLKGSSWLLRR